MTTPARQHAQKLFEESSKDEAVGMLMADLLMTLGRNPNPALCSLYSDLLADLTIDELSLAFGEALNTKAQWLTPGQIRDLALGQDSNADDAWAWVAVYLRDHGVSGNVKPGALIEHPVHIPGRFREVKPGQYAAVPFGIGRDYPLTLPDIPAPEIPEAVKLALRAIGGTIKQGLERINYAQGNEIGFIRKEFAAAFVRAEREA